MSENPEIILLDIEGTTSSIRFVYDVMFPFVRSNLEPFLRDYWKDERMGPVLEQMAHDLGINDFKSWAAETTSEASQRSLVMREVSRLMDNDVKATGLKMLQGLIWTSGFESGELIAHVYEDVPPAMMAWTKEGKKIYIYSSGSVVAQKQFFGHTDFGNLLPMISGHFDTTIGPKKEAKSYQKIVKSIGIPPGKIVFVSDVVEELDAARTAGMQTFLSIRRGNHPITNPNGHISITSLDQVSEG